MGVQKNIGPQWTGHCNDSTNVFGVFFVDCHEFAKSPKPQQSRRYENFPKKVGRCVCVLFGDFC